MAIPASCGWCGRIIVTGEARCAGCGGVTSPPVGTPIVPPPTLLHGPSWAPRAAVPVTNRPRPKRGPWIVAVVVTTALAVIVVSALAFRDAGDTTTDSPSTPPPRPTSTTPATSPTPTTTGELTTAAVSPPPASTTGATLVLPTIAVDTTTPVSPASPVRPVLRVASDLPLQGGSAEASSDTNLAIRLLLKQAGGVAGIYPVELTEYDDSTAEAGSWDDATCTRNALAHVAQTTEVAVLGTYNSGCAKLQVPVLNEAADGPMLMISHANTNPGLTKLWDAGEPGKYYPTGVRNYGRLIPSDDFQGIAGARFAAEDLGLRRCVVLDDENTFGWGVAQSFAEAATGAGIDVVVRTAWDPNARSYLPFFQNMKRLNPDCIYLGGINDSNGEQLIRDKVAVFGPNDGAVKLIAPDGFSGYPTLGQLAEAQGMYITFGGLPIDEMIARSPAAATFVDAFTTEFGHAPTSPYALYGAAAMQYIVKSIAASDGTRRGVRDVAFSGQITVSAEESLIGQAFSLDPASGDVAGGDLSVQQMSGGVEVFLTSVTVG